MPPTTIDVVKYWRLVIDDAVSSDHMSRILALEAKRRLQDFVVLPRINAQGMTGAALKARLYLDKPRLGDKMYTVLIGDSVPHLYLNCSPDGHDPRDLWACKLFFTEAPITIDANGRCSIPIANGRFEVPWGAVSRIKYDQQPGLGLSSSVLYGRKLDQMLTWEGVAIGFGTKVGFNNHLYYGLVTGDLYFISMGMRLDAQIPSVLLNEYDELPTNAPDGTDGQWARWGSQPVLLAVTFSGGYEQFAEGLYYAGTVSTWMAAKPMAAVAAFWGSFEGDYFRPNNLPTGASTNEYTYISVYDVSGYFAFAVFFAGGTLGDASIETVRQNPNNPAFYITDLIGGDSAMSLPDPMLAITQLQQQVAAAQLPDLSQYVKHSDLPNFSQFVTQQALADQLKQLASQPVTAIGGSTTSPGQGIVPVAAPMRINPSDLGYVGGNVYALPGVPLVTGVPNALDPSAYSLCRSATEADGLRFSINVAGLTPSMAYTIRLHFCEGWHTAPKQRVQNVTINSTNALSGFDIFAAAGGILKAVVRDCMAISDPSGHIAIVFTGAAGCLDPHPIVSVIEVLK